MVLHKKRNKSKFLIPAVFLGFIVLFAILAFSRNTYSVNFTKDADQLASTSGLFKDKEPVWPAVLDTTEYNKRILALNNYIPPQPAVATTSTSTVATTTAVLPVYGTTTNAIVPGKRWPTSMVYPNGDAIVPFKRILAYYGNFYSKKMGILGEYDQDEVLRRLASTTALWEAADPTTPILPAIEYIAMVAQGSAGKDGMYRTMMPDEEIEKAYNMAQKVEGILILDLQVGLSTVEKEVPKFKSYLTKPDIHIALDPEFSMKGGNKPGSVIGTMSAADVNYTIAYLSNIVKENKLPPKILFVHRFTERMVTNSELIRPTPEVQVVMIMDGWGSKDLKRRTYSTVIDQEPVQFTGIKLFYKNDLKTPSTGILTPAEVLQLKPKPIYVQYQ